jgi:hypothetical protein
MVIGVKTLILIFLINATTLNHASKFFFLLTLFYRAGTKEDIRGECKEGYKGTVCGDCEDNYAKTGIYCSECPA